MRKELSETEVITTVKEIRSQAPGIGAYKLFLDAPGTVSQRDERA